MPRDSSPKRERQYKRIKESGQKRDMFSARLQAGRATAGQGGG